MRENNISAPVELRDEIARALATLKKSGYTVESQGDGSDNFSLVFHLGENEQTIKFTGDEWRNAGTVEQRIIDKLEI